ncbi:MAG: hypothetical protein Q8R04_00645 [Nanoarchaeota archaeon]|nr:hypothetical protein [Nanoarchaeota archaeon]
MNHNSKNIIILSIQFLVFCILITNIYAQEGNKYDEKTGLDKDGYANPNKPIPTATTNFKLKQGPYKTEDGITLTASGNTEVKRNPDGSFDIGGNKVKGTNIQYINNQYNIIGKGSINTIPVFNVHNLHFLPRKYREDYVVEKAIMVGESGEEPSSVGNTIFKPKGTIFMYEATSKLGGNILGYDLSFKNDVTITDLTQAQGATLKAKDAKITLPSGHILEGGTIIFDKGQAYIGYGTQINGVVIYQDNNVQTPSTDYLIKLYLNGEIPFDKGRWISIGKEHLIARIDTENFPIFSNKIVKDNIKLYLKENNPYTSKEISFMVDSGGELNIKIENNKPTNLITLKGNSNLWNRKYAISSENGEVSAYVNSLIDYRDSEDLEVEISDLNGNRLLEENIVITKDGTLKSSALKITNNQELAAKHNIRFKNADENLIGRIKKDLENLPEFTNRITIEFVPEEELPKRCSSSDCYDSVSKLIIQSYSGGLHIHEIMHGLHDINDEIVIERIDKALVAANLPIKEEIFKHNRKYYDERTDIIGYLGEDGKIYLSYSQKEAKHEDYIFKSTVNNFDSIKKLPGIQETFFSEQAVLSFETLQEQRDKIQELIGLSSSDIDTILNKRSDYDTMLWINLEDGRIAILLSDSSQKIEDVSENIVKNFNAIKGLPDIRSRFPTEVSLSFETLRDQKDKIKELTGLSSSDIDLMLDKEMTYLKYRKISDEHWQDSFSYKWIILSGENQMTRDLQEEIAKLGSYAYLTPEFFKNKLNPSNPDYDPQYKAKLRLMAGAKQPLLTRWEYLKITGEEYKPLTQEELNEVLKFQEKKGQRLK